MIRRFCDGCDIDITAERGSRVKRSLQLNGHEITAEVITSVDGAWNGGHLCHACVVNVVSLGRQVTE